MESPSNRILCRRREILTAHAAGIERCKEFHACMYHRLRQNRPQRIPDRLVAIKSRFRTQAAVTPLETQCDGLQQATSRNHRLQQGAVKPEHPRTISRRAFWKHRKPLTPEQRCSDQAINPPRVQAPAPGNKHGPGPCREPTHTRPVPHLGLGNETHGQYRIDDEDIQPRHVIGHEQHRGVCRP